MASRRTKRGSGLTAALLMVAFGIRQCGAYQERQRKAESDRALAELRERYASMTPGPERTVMTPAPSPVPSPTKSGRGTASPTLPPESHEGWVVEGLTAWCESGRWAGSAAVRATTETPRTWGFVFTLTDGKQVVGTLSGEDPRHAFMDGHEVTLTSRDECSQGTFGYRWTVVP
jgi:hypothetical protein